MLKWNTFSTGLFIYLKLSTCLSALLNQGQRVRWRKKNPPTKYVQQIIFVFLRLKCSFQGKEEFQYQLASGTGETGSCLKLWVVCFPEDRGDEIDFSSSICSSTGRFPADAAELRGQTTRSSSYCRGWWSCPRQRDLWFRTAPSRGYFAALGKLRKEQEKQHTLVTAVAQFQSHTQPFHWLCFSLS